MTTLACNLWALTDIYQDKNTEYGSNVCEMKKSWMFGDGKLLISGISQIRRAKMR